MNLYYRLVHILKKIVYTFFILSISYNQDYPNGSFSLDQIFFQLNSLGQFFYWDLANIASEFSKDSLNNGKLSLNLLKIGFDDLAVKNNNNGHIQLIIIGPNVELEDLEINTDYTFPNYYNLILSDLSDNRYETPMDGLEILEKAVNTFKIQKGKYPDSYNDLIIESYINSSKYPFNKSEWSYHLDLPRTVKS